MPPHAVQQAENELKKLHVNILRNSKIIQTKPTTGGQTEVRLENSQSLITDLYLPTIGVVPNTDYIPKDFLTGTGHVVVDQFLRVRDADGVWAAGDVLDIQPSQIVYTGESTWDVG